MWGVIHKYVWFNNKGTPQIKMVKREIGTGHNVIAIYFIKLLFHLLVAIIWCKDEHICSHSCGKLILHLKHPHHCDIAILRRQPNNCFRISRTAIVTSLFFCIHSDCHFSSTWKKIELRYSVKLPMILTLLFLLLTSSSSSLGLSV